MLIYVRLNQDIKTYNEGAPDRGPLNITCEIGKGGMRKGGIGNFKKKHKTYGSFKVD